MTERKFVKSLKGLPPPDCSGGYSVTLLKQHMDGQQLARLNVWMTGQTMMFCTGKLYDHDKQEYIDDCETPHGAVIYSHDLERFLHALPIIDW